MAVPGHEQFSEISNTNNRTCQHNYLIHHFNMLEGNIFFQCQYFSGYHQQCLHHGKTGEDGTRNEVRREDGGMPARNNRGGEVEGYDRMH